MYSKKPFINFVVWFVCPSRMLSVGMVLTPAGATYPYGKDPKDSNIRVAPSFPPVSELSLAMDVFCICAKLAAAKKILGK